MSPPDAQIDLDPICVRSQRLPILANIPIPANEIRHRFEPWICRAGGTQSARATLTGYGANSSQASIDGLAEIDLRSLWGECYNEHRDDFRAS